MRQSEYDGSDASGLEEHVVALTSSRLVASAVQVDEDPISAERGMMKSSPKFKAGVGAGTGEQRQLDLPLALTTFAG